MFNHIFTYLQSHHVITPYQSGFMSGDSCVNQLLYISNNIYKELDNKNSVCAVFLDFTKAFDKVSHKGLIYKFHKYGIRGKTLSWLTDYLHRRSQQVVIKGQSSTWRHIQAGVPQGSVLGPLCFLVYINDIIENISSKIYLFADDASIFRPIRDNSAFDDTKLLNEDLNTISLWAERWKLKISLPKTVSLLFSRKINPPPVYPLVINGTPLQNVESHKHLGLIFSKQYAVDTTH